MHAEGNPKAWSTQDIPDQSGRIVLITGTNSGTGFEAARALARRGAHVILGCRQLERALGAEQRLRSEIPGASLERLSLDLASLASVRKAADALRSQHGRLDLLLNNAGVMIPPYGKTEDGFELQFGTNHLGPFALTGLLLPLLLETPGSRVVTMSSVAHKMGRIRFEDLQSERGYHSWKAYGQSKLANLLFTFELQRRLVGAQSDTLAVAAHPGWARTELQRHADRNPVLRVLMSSLGALFAQDADQGALPLLRAAVDPAVRGGEYYGPSRYGECKGAPVLVKTSARAQDEAIQRRLWECSERLTGVVFPV